MYNELVSQRLDTTGLTFGEIILKDLKFMNCECENDKIGMSISNLSETTMFDIITKNGNNFVNDIKHFEKMRNLDCAILMCVYGQNTDDIKRDLGVFSSNGRLLNHFSHSISEIGNQIGLKPIQCNLSNNKILKSHNLKLKGTFNNGLNYQWWHTDHKWSRKQITPVFAKLFKNFRI